MIIMNSSGVCLFSRDYTDIEIPEQIFSGLIMSIRDLAFEISKKALKTIELGDWLLHYVIGEIVSIVMITDNDDDKNILSEKAVWAINYFMETYSDHLENFRGNTTPFVTFKESCDEVFVLDWNFDFNQRVKGRKS